MKVSQLTLNVAFQITSNRFELLEFYSHSLTDQFIYFTHTNFFYSYPIFGKIWPDGKACQFHRVQTCCSICGQAPDRNFAGYGSLLLQRTGVDQRMSLVCMVHKSGSQFDPNLFSKPQLSLFQAMLMRCIDNHFMRMKQVFFQGLIKKVKGPFSPFYLLQVTTQTEELFSPQFFYKQSQ